MNDECTDVAHGEAGAPSLRASKIAGSSHAATQCITVDSFPAGTVFSVGLRPSRSGQPAGDRGEPALVT